MESMFSSNRPGWAALLDEKVTAYLPDLKYVHDEPLARHTSFRIGGPATRMAFPTSGEQIVLLTGFAQECGVTPFLLGNGTNLLVADEGLDTLVIQTGEGLNRIALDGGIITADAGVSLARLGVFAWQHSLTGLEFAHGIPGSLGGGVVMNAGAYGGELKDVLTEVTALFPDGVRTLRGEELALGYRRSFRRPSRRAWRSFRPSAAQASRLRCRAPAAPSSAPRDTSRARSSSGAASRASTSAGQRSAASTRALWSTPAARPARTSSRSSKKYRIPFSRRRA